MAEAPIRRSVIAGAAASAALALAALQPARAAEADAVIGLWQQVGSDAGSCPACTVAFLPDGPALAVLANNGWSARLRGSGGVFDGAGRWAETGRAWVSGRPFTVSVRLEGERLDMVMTVEAGAGARRIVRGRFRRAWQGV